MHTQVALLYGEGLVAAASLWLRLQLPVALGLTGEGGGRARCEARVPIRLLLTFDFDFISFSLEGKLQAGLYRNFSQAHPPPHLAPLPSLT